MQHPSARRSARGQARPCNQAIGATTCIVFPDFVGGIVHRLACLPTNQRSRLCIRTNSSPTRREKPKPGQIRANRGRLVGRRQTDLSHWLLSLSSILLVDSLSRASGKAYYPLRRTIQENGVKERRSFSRWLVSNSSNQISSMFFPVEVFREIYFVSFDGIRVAASQLISPNHHFKQKISQGVMSRFEPQRWIYMYIYICIKL